MATNYFWKCPDCGEVLTTMDAVGSERLMAAVSWWEEKEIVEEWYNFIDEHRYRWCPSLEDKKEEE